MLSSDKNVESVAQLIEVLKDYIGLQKEYLKFDVIDKMVKILTALIFSIIILLLTIAILFYFSFAAVYWMAPVTGLAGAYAIVSGFFLLMIVLTVTFRKRLIEKPLIRFMTGILLS